MNKFIALALSLLFVLMLLTALSAVWLRCIYLTIMGGVGVVIALLVCHALYEIQARKKAKHQRDLKRIKYEIRERKITSDELFRSYTASEWR